MRVLLTGAAGQLGRALQAAQPAGVTLAALDRAALDIADAAAVQRVFAELRPDLVINAAAFTAVDLAEAQPAAAQRVNTTGPATLASAAAAQPDCRMINVSTDYVFAGDASRACRPGDATGPVSVYGASKLAGEQAVSAALGARAVNLRTAWLYGTSGKNFLLTMLRLMREHGQVRVVADQIGCPTAAHSLAGAIWALAQRSGIAGVQHWTDAGVASWYDFAVAIAEEAAARGLLARAAEVTPISTSDYPTPARRPGFSLLDCGELRAQLQLPARHWRHCLRQTLDQIAHG